MSHCAFLGFDRLVAGSLAETYAACRDLPGALIFDLESGRVVDIDPCFPPDADVPRPGRPRLGVAAREVTLLPRHWDWLASQPGGASLALRNLVEEAMRDPQIRRRARREAACRFATATVRNAPGYEEAMQALDAGDSEDFAAHIESWPPDIRQTLEEMTQDAF
jgi:hypothetical protein